MAFPELTLHTVDEARIRVVERFVKERMSHFDASHDYDHIRRVVALARHIYEEESKEQTAQTLSWHIVHVSALLHDVFDHKYTTSEDFEAMGMTVPEFFHQSFALSTEDAEAVAEIVQNESYSHEMKNQESTRNALEKYPELGIVQDADRLDALGAVGIGRCFYFGGATGRGERLQDTMAHFNEKLVLLEGSMKTETGKRLAKKRTERLKLFQIWWNEEFDIGKNFEKSE